jgi:hypothetical protein
MQPADSFVEQCASQGLASSIGERETCRADVNNVTTKKFTLEGKYMIYHTKPILPVVLCGCESWSLTLKDENMPWVFGNRMLRKIFLSNMDEVIGGWRNCIMRCFISCTPGQILE